MSAAELVLDTSPLAHERAMERARSYAQLKAGWYEGLARGRERYTMGGPVEQAGIDEACEVIAWCQAHGVAAPSVTPAPRSDMTSGVSLEWDTPDVWAEWMAPGVWELVATGHGGLAVSGEDVIAALKGLS